MLVFIFMQVIIQCRGAQAIDNIYVSVTVYIQYFIIVSDVQHNGKIVT